MVAMVGISKDVLWILKEKELFLKKVAIFLIKRRQRITYRLNSTLKKKIVITVGSIIFRLINLYTRGM